LPGDRVIKRTDAGQLFDLFARQTVRRMPGDFLLRLARIKR
jgi:hypothetical protein